MIDGIVKMYPTYTHDDVYKKSIGEVIALDDLNRRQQYIQSKISEERRKQQ